MAIKVITKMTRPTCVYFDENALLNNLRVVRKYAATQKIIAMVKANAYGCGINKVIPILSKEAYAFGVSCIEEALAIRNIDANLTCILFQGIFSKEEIKVAYKNNFQMVIHQQRQLDWLLQSSNDFKIKIWVKVDTGMHRLGFQEEEVAKVMQKLAACPWVDKHIGMISHLAFADEICNVNNAKQLNKFSRITNAYENKICSIANSAAILGLPDAQLDVVRPGLMLYGVSPIKDKLAKDFGLEPVMRFVSKITEIHDYPAHSAIGYSGIWQSDKPSRIGLIPVGYADGYPRVVNSLAKVWVSGHIVPIVGRISMDMLTIDLTTCKNVQIGEEVELWGRHIPIEEAALAAGTVSYEILTKIGSRVIRK
jgi:alanine racemase